MPYAPSFPYGALSGGVGYTGDRGLQIIDELLTNVAKQFRPDGFIYEDLFAPMPVTFNIGRYPVFDPTTFFQTGGNLQVADDAPTPRIDFNWSTDVYDCTDKRLQTVITRKEALQANPALRLDYSKTVGLLSVFALNREVRAAAKLRAQSNGGQFTAAAVNPSVQWDVGTSGSPANIQGDIQSAVQAARKVSGRRPNTIAMDLQVALAIANDFTIKDQVKYQIGPRVVAEGMPAVLPPTLFGLKVVIADDANMAFTGRPGDAATLGTVWGNSVRLLYTDPNAQWGTPATAYAFRGQVTEGSHQPPASVMPSGDGGMEPGPAGGWAVVDRWWDYDPPGEHIRAWECVDERLVAPELGIEIQNVLSSSY